MNARNPLVALKALGQSIWLDYLDLEIIANGRLMRLIREDGLCGITSNPSIIDQSMGQSEAAELIVRLKKTSRSADELYESLAIDYVAKAADLLSDVYEETDARDGYVSIEVSPRFGHDVDATCAEARRLFERTARPNIMVKVPATLAGVQSMRRLIRDGINVNATLLFSVARYEQIADAYLNGLEDRASAGFALSRIASVASFFLSRIDTLVDAKLERRNSPDANRLRGTAAIACARLAYQKYLQLVNGPRFLNLASKSARPQRLLWASTSTKNPAYSDVKYVEALIGPDTVNTLPLETVDAYRDHGAPAARLQENLDEAQKLPQQLAAFDIRLEDVSAQLEREGLEKFAQAYDRSIAKLREQFGG